MKIFSALLVLLFFQHSLVFSQTKNFIDQPYIEVSGRADTLLTPNEIYIKIVLSEKDSRDRVSLQDLEIKMVSAMNTLGINTEKDLRASDMESNFKFYLLKSRDVIKSKNYTLMVPDAVTATKVFIKLEELNISNTSIDRVAHSGVQAVKNQMRTKAIIDAKARAIALTLPLNQTIGAAIHVVDADNFSDQLQGKVAGIQIRGTTTIQSDYFGKLAIVEFEKIMVVSTVAVKFVLK